MHDEAPQNEIHPQAPASLQKVLPKTQATEAPSADTHGGPRVPSTGLSTSAMLYCVCLLIFHLNTVRERGAENVAKSVMFLGNGVVVKFSREASAIGC